MERYEKIITVLYRCEWGFERWKWKTEKEFTVEGIHMYANGYQVVLNNLKKYL